MLDLEKINKNYEEYKETKMAYEKMGKELEQYKKDNDLYYLLDIIDILKTTIKNDSKKTIEKYGMSLIDKLISSNIVLKKYIGLKNVHENTKRAIYDIMHKYVIQEYQRYIALKHDLDDNYDLVELYTQDIVDLSEFDDEKKQYIIELLKNASSFIGYATRDDLPLLMNILEEYDIVPNYDDMEEVDIAEEEYLYNESISSSLGLKLIRAHMFDDNIEEKIYTTFDGKKEKIEHHFKAPIDIDEKIKDLEYNKESMAKDMYLYNYFFYTILKKRNIEELYLNADEEEKRIIIDVYEDILSSNDYNIMTSSPIINQEILKRRKTLIK